MFYQLFKYLLFVPVFRLVCRPWMKGHENVPRAGGGLLVSNHISWGDTIILPVMLRRRVTFPAKAELFNGTSPGARLVGWFLKQAGILPIDRGGGKASSEALTAMTDIVKSGTLLAMYPEGTRSPDGRLYKGKTGAARVALETGCPVIPVGMSNTEVIKGRGLPRMDRPGVLIGKPVDLSRFRGRPIDAGVLRDATDAIMADIQKLTGQEYVDLYGAVVKSGSYAGDVDAKVLPHPGWKAPVEAGDDSEQR